MAAKKKLKAPAKHKWSSVAVGAIHRKALKDLTQRALHAEERELIAARSRMNAKVSGRADTVRQRTSLIAGMDSRLRAVMASYGRNVPFSLELKYQDAAYTDFTSITVEVSHHRHQLCWDSEGNLNVEAARRLVAGVRGMFYHELGHLLFTVPFEQLLSLADEDNCKALLLSKLCKDAEGVHRGFGPKELRAAWNLLEDQRQEAMLVQDSPQMAVYLTAAVLDVVLQHDGPTSFLYTVGRTYLPDTIRKGARSRWDAEVTAPSSEAIEALVASYMISTSPLEMLQLSADLAEIQAKASVNPNPSDARPTGKEVPTDTITTVGKALSKQADDSKDASKGDATGDSTSDSDDSTSDSGETADADGASGGTGTDGITSKEFIAAVRGALSDLYEALSDDETSKDDIAAINGALHGTGNSLPRADPIGTVTDDDDGVESKARAIVNGIVTAFEVAVADSAPHWESGQRNGVLEAVRYRTRQPGDDLDVFRSWQDNGEVGQDMYVDLFLDISGSMARSVVKLGAAAWAVKRACDELGVPCQVTLFNESGAVLYAADEKAGYDIPKLECDGGTDPLEAFAGALIERKVKHHIVMVMTDGEWSDENVFAQFETPNMLSVGFNYEIWGWSGEDTDGARGMAWGRTLNFNEGHFISDLFAIPKKLEETLLGLV